jgi:small subunit ribosomal protein S20
LPVKKSAYKELRKAKKRHFRNISLKSELKTLAKRFEKLVSEKKVSEAKDFLKTLVSKLDKAATKGIIHKNAASRKTSRLTKKLSALSKA